MSRKVATSMVATMLLFVSGCEAPANESQTAQSPSTSTPSVSEASETPRPTSTSLAASDAGEWTANESSDPMDDVTNVTLSLMSESSLPLPFPYNDESAFLLIRCKKRRTELYVVTQVPVQTSYDGDFDELGSLVRYRFDGGKPNTAYWSESTDHKAVFSDAPVALARKLAKTQEWVFEFTPFDAGSVTVSFRTTGLEAVLPKVAQACNWKV